MKFNQPTTRNVQKGVKNEDEEKKKKKYEQKWESKRQTDSKNMKDEYLISNGLLPPRSWDAFPGPQRKIGVGMAPYPTDIRNKLVGGGELRGLTIP